MISYTENTKVCLYWHERPLTAGEAFGRMEAFLRQLQRRDGPFSSWCLMHERGYLPLDPDLGNLRDALIENRSRDVLYTNADSNDGSFSLSSYSWAGYRAGFTNSSSDKARTVIATIFCGQNKPPGKRGVAPDSVLITISPEIETPALLRSLLEEAVNFWRPNDGVVSRADVRRRLGPSVGVVLTGELEPGWLTYFADQRVRRVVPKGYVVEPLGEGVVIELAERPGKADDEEYVSRLVALRDALRPYGILSRRQLTETS